MVIYIKSQTDLIGILIVLFLETNLCIALVFEETEAYSLIQPLMFVPHLALNSKEFQFTTKSI